MNYLRYILFIFFLVGIIGFSLPQSAHCESSQKEIEAPDTADHVIIKSDTFEIDNNKKTVTFSGNVDARKDTFTINCQKMVLYFTGKPGEEDSKRNRAKIEQIVALSKVRISRQDGSLALCDKAVYYQNDEKLVLTGSPVIKQGEDFVEGAVITVYLKENRSVVKGAGGIKAKAVLVPSGY